MTLADTWVIAATLLAWWSLVPQIRKLVRTGDASGVSSTWPAIGLVANAGWTAYLLSQELWAAAPSTAGMVVFYVLVLRSLQRAGVSLRTALIRGAVAVALLGAVTVAGSWPVLGLVLGWAYLPQLAPAVWSAYRSHDPSGVAVGTWTVILVEAALWLVYGRLVGDVPVLIYSVVGVASSGLILARLAATVGLRPRTAGAL